MIYDLWEWGCDFALTCQDVYNWLFNTTDILGYSIRPIYLLCGSFLIIGIVRSLTDL